MTLGSSELKNGGLQAAATAFSPSVINQAKKLNINLPLDPMFGEPLVTGALFYGMGKLIGGRAGPKAFLLSAGSAAVSKMAVENLFNLESSLIAAVPSSARPSRVTG
jgi:hypothetical protein